MVPDGQSRNVAGPETYVRPTPDRPVYSPFYVRAGARPQLSRVPALGAEITPGTPSVPAVGTESARELRELASSPIVIGLGIGETLFVNTVGPTLWPFSRLVHGWSLPFQYRGRPYILCRRRLAALPRR